MMDTTTSRRRRSAPGRSSPAIVARGLTKRFGRVQAVDDLSFEVRPGG